MSGAKRYDVPKLEQEPEVDASLGTLERLSACRFGLPAYYASLLTDDREVLRVAAMAALLELDVLLPVHWDLALEMSRYQAVRSRAFKFFMSRHEYELALQVAQCASASEHTARTARMFAEHELDFASCLKLDGDLFLATGSVDHLYEAQRTAESLGGWRLIVPWAVLSILAQPMDPRGPYLLFNHLLAANQINRIEALCDIFRKASMYPRETAVYGAFVSTAKGRPKDAIRILAELPTGIGLRSTIMLARAQAFEALGQFRPAYNSYVQMNEVDIAPKSTMVDIIKRALDRAACDFGDMPPDERSANHFIMLGFPRSGTTLLENALAAHPHVETFEEIPSYARLTGFLDRHVKLGQAVPRAIALEARQRYYEEADRRSLKVGAHVFVDKLPLYSAAIKTLEKLLPGKKYIFSIRHPFDVVLSCFKQHFARNNAMEYFRRLPDACRYYDFAMSQWFDVFTLEERERVVYVRYEDLVNDFQVTTTRVFKFMGTEWDDGVFDFAARADQRAARTPSYQKVRAGLSVGVQSSWRNYAFLFDNKETAPLKRWVEYFGYDV